MMMKPCRATAGDLLPQFPAAGGSMAGSHDIHQTLTCPTTPAIAAAAGGHARRAEKKARSKCTANRALLLNF